MQKCKYLPFLTPSIPLYSKAFFIKPIICQITTRLSPVPCSTGRCNNVKELVESESEKIIPKVRKWPKPSFFSSLRLKNFLVPTLTTVSLAGIAIGREELMYHPHVLPPLKPMRDISELTTLASTRRHGEYPTQVVLHSQRTRGRRLLL